MTHQDNDPLARLLQIVSQPMVTYEVSFLVITNRQYKSYLEGKDNKDGELNAKNLIHQNMIPDNKKKHCKTYQ